MLGVVRQARVMKDIALEWLKENSVSPANNSQAPDSDTDTVEAASSLSEPKRPYTGYQCLQSDQSRAEQNPNARTIDILQEMAAYYDQVQDQWRTLAYRKAIAALRRQTHKITTKEEASCLAGIGPRLAEKIEEIVATDKLRRLEATHGDPAERAVRLFMGIYGVGACQAHRWISQGHRTLQHLVDHVCLTENQKVGIAHYGHFGACIPRHEVAMHGELVRRALDDIDPGFEVAIMGSYRRGAPSSGDIDLMITKRGASLCNLHAVVFNALVPQLFDQGFLKARLAASRGGSGTTWHGASALPGSGIWRRIDLLLVPEEELGAALIYFTGNDMFNRSIRLLARKKGMRLNEHGLYKDVMRDSNRQRLTEGSLAEGKCERRIFELLGVPWQSPRQRAIS